jgi:pimeloyl-ACP methyl ester carboxylesterase/DNA-binding CsgD family transcriptional regulator
MPPVQYLTTSDGCRLAYAVSGSGTPLVWVPSVWSHFARFWRAPRRLLLEELAQRFQLIEYDQRGQGSSARGLSAEVSIDDYERDLHSVIEHLRVPRCILLAISTGAHLALRYAIAHPDRVMALILFNVDDAEHGWRSDAYLNLAASDWETFLQTAAVVAFGGPTNPRGAKTLPILRDSITQADWIKMIRALRGSDAMDRLGEIEAPTLLFFGRRDPLFSEESVREMAVLLPRSRLVVLEDETLGLLPRDGRPPPAISTIDSFVRDVRAEAGAIPKTAQLSSRELDVFRLLAAGRTNSQIAQALHISPNTAAKHVARILAKTGTANRSEATAYALRNRLV